MVDIRMIREAVGLVRRELEPTPLIHSEHFSSASGAELWLKLENLQRTGSFKIRGALHRIHSCRDRIGPSGVVAASAGNHAQGVALAAARLGIPACIVMPESAPISKQLATREYGGEVRLHGDTVGAALERARSMEGEGYTFVHPFDDPYVISGQATVGIELLEQLDTFDEVWIPVGGGGLASGIALAIHEQRPDVRIIGVQSEACPSALRALEASRPVRVEPARTIADGIAVPRIGQLPLEILSHHLHEMITAEEGDIALAMVRLLDNKKLVTEGAGATALAALLNAAPSRLRRRRIVVVLSGGNVDLTTLDRVLEMGLMRTGRILRFSVALDDRPGALARLLRVLSGRRANVLNVVHDRLGTLLPVGVTRVSLTVETRDFDHHQQIREALTEAGYRLEPENETG